MRVVVSPCKRRKNEFYALLCNSHFYFVRYLFRKETHKKKNTVAVPAGFFGDGIHSQTRLDYNVYPIRNLWNRYFRSVFNFCYKRTFLCDDFRSEFHWTCHYAESASFGRYFERNSGMASFFLKILQCNEHMELQHGYCNI